MLKLIHGSGDDATAGGEKPPGDAPAPEKMVPATRENRRSIFAKFGIKRIRNPRSKKKKD